jgi:hypothetical protein
VGNKSPLINPPWKGDRKFYTVRYLIIFPLPFQGVGVGGEYYTHPVGADYNTNAPIGANIKNKNSTDILRKKREFYAKNLFR